MMLYQHITRRNFAAGQCNCIWFIESEDDILGQKKSFEGNRLCNKSNKLNYNKKTEEETARASPF